MTDERDVSREQLREIALRTVRESPCVMVFGVNADQDGIMLGIVGDEPPEGMELVLALMNGACASIARALQESGLIDPTMRWKGH